MISLEIITRIWYFNILNYINSDIISFYIIRVHGTMNWSADITQLYFLFYKYANCK